MRSEDILAQIDNTLEDYTVSDDAMRSRPPVEPDETSGPQLWIAPVGTAPDADGWQEAGFITSGDFTIDPTAITTPAPTVTWQELSDYIAEIQAERARRAQQLMQAFVQAFTESIEAVRPRIEEAGRAFASLQQSVEQAAPPLPPGRRHDRPAWQSPYGPTQCRR